jgi:hypothetical protein
LFFLSSARRLGLQDLLPGAAKIPRDQNKPAHAEHHQHAIISPGNCGNGHRPNAMMTTQPSLARPVEFATGVRHMLLLGRAGTQGAAMRPTTNVTWLSLRWIDTH